MMETKKMMHDNVVFITKEIAAPAADAAETAYQTLNKIENELNCQRSSKYNILKINVYVPDLTCWHSMESGYQKFFGSYQPVNQVIPCDTNNHISFEVIAQKDSYFAN